MKTAAIAGRYFYSPFDDVVTMTRLSGQLVIVHPSKPFFTAATARAKFLDHYDRLGKGIDK